MQLSGIHWWYKTASHAAELTSGFYNPCNRDGYAPIAAMLKKHGVALNFTCVELRTMDQEEVFPEALADPEGLVWQVIYYRTDFNWHLYYPVGIRDLFQETFVVKRSNDLTRPIFSGSFFTRLFPAGVTSLMIFLRGPPCILTC